MKHKTTAIGRAHINGQWVPIISSNRINRGRDKDKIRVSYWKLTSASVYEHQVKYFNGK